LFTFLTFIIVAKFVAAHSMAILNPDM